jgi:hypothetical protein
MNRTVTQESPTRKVMRFGFALAIFVVFYVSAVIGFIIIY